MLKCIISTSIPSEWAPALCNADETGLKNASDLDRPFLQAVIDSETGEE